MVVLNFLPIKTFLNYLKFWSSRRLRALRSSPCGGSMQPRCPRNRGHEKRTSIVNLMCHAPISDARMNVKSLLLLCKQPGLMNSLTVAAPWLGSIVRGVLKFIDGDTKPM
jgi:hypothetical protein